MKFSQRYGYTPVKDVIQIDYMDDDLRTSLWTVLVKHYWRDFWYFSDWYERELTVEATEIWTALWTDFFKRRIDTCPTRKVDVDSEIERYFFKCQWYDVYDFVEFIPQVDPGPCRPADFRQAVNVSLERELSGYRFVNGQITPITDQIEIDEIETAMAGKTRAVSEQFNRALQLLSNRENPDYRNSVKESISAVEGQVKSTLEMDKGTLGDLLKRFDQHAPLHPALKDAFTKLYGYTSDASGIRHALLENDQEPTFEEAKFMLVTCSAFVNYVRGTTKS